MISRRAIDAPVYLRQLGDTAILLDPSGERKRALRGIRSKEGEPITAFDSNKVRALFAYLAVQSKRPHSREALATLLWPEFPDRVARTNLRNALAILRKEIGDRRGTGDRAPTPSHLIVTREAMQFSAASDHRLDVATFWGLAAQAIEGRAQGGQAPDLGKLEEALDLYRGPFLEDHHVGDSAVWEEWHLKVREQRERKGLEALERAAGDWT